MPNLITALLERIALLVYGWPLALAVRASRSAGRGVRTAAASPRAPEAGQRSLAQACGGRRGGDLTAALNRATIGRSGAGLRDGPPVLPWRPAS